jgi:L-iditol 2-dehydrogenase
MGDPPYNGAFAECVAWPAAFAYRMPAEMTFDEGALVEPLSIAAYATGRAHITPGDRVLVMGAGPVGLMTLIAAVTHGATEIYVVDVIDWRLDTAKEFGATTTINAKSEKVTEKIRELTKGEYVDVTMETSGSPDAAAQSVKVTRRGGTIALIGLYDSAELQYPLLDVLMKEISVVGNYDGAHSFPTSLQIMASRKFDAKKMITHHLPLDQIETGFKIMEAKKEHVLKIQIHP